MISKIRQSLLITVVAVAVAATSAATAVGSEFHSESPHTLLQGVEASEKTYEYEFGSLKWNCENLEYEGTSAVSTTSTIEIFPTSSGACGIPFTLIGVGMFFNGCGFRFHTEKAGSPATMDIVCPNGQAIQIRTVYCDITIPPQTGLTSVTHEKLVGEEALAIGLTTEIQGVKYSQLQTSPIGVCPNISASDGKIELDTVIYGFNTVNTPVGVWV